MRDGTVADVGQLALLCAACGAAVLVLPGAGKYLAVGLGILAVVAGAMAYRKREERATS